MGIESATLAYALQKVFTKPLRALSAIKITQKVITLMWGAKLWWRVIFCFDLKLASANVIGGENECI